MFTMPLIDHGFSAWEEHIVCPERGSRLVHYYLKNEFGDSVLAVIGTERSIRHMTFVVSNEFLQFFGSNKSINASTKWRARREVVRWLTSMMSRNHPGLSSETNNSAQGSGSIDMLRNEEGACDVFVPDLPFQRKLKVHNSYMEWSGTAWFCTKQLKHYTAFCKTGITIAVHSFVFIMAEEENHYLAYLEDMYEDKKGQKKLKVRWFHYSQEVKDIIPQLNPHPREVLRSHNVQVISAYCVTGLATVLTPRHYEKYEAVVPHTSISDVYMCCRQFKENKLKPFALNKLSGYSSQPLLSLLAGPLVPKQREEKEELTCNDYMRVWGKRLRSTDGDDGLGCCSGSRDSVLEHQIANHEPTYPKLKIRLLRKTQGVEFVAPRSQFLSPFKVDEKIELLCQDSGIRGCWFRCKVLQASAKYLKVQYDDLLDVDGAGNLQGWVPVAKIAAADRLGMRCWGRHTIRPTPPQHSNDHDFDVGAAVDAWWCDGWWEGVILGVSISGDNSLQIYFPGESKILAVQKKDVRVSRDWVDDKWVDVNTKPDIQCFLPGYVSSNITPSASELECDKTASLEQNLTRSFKLEAIEEDEPMVADDVDNITLVGLGKDNKIIHEDEIAISRASKDDGNCSESNKGMDVATFHLNVESTAGEKIKRPLEEEFKSLNHICEAARTLQVITDAEYRGESRDQILGSNSSLSTDSVVLCT